MDENSWAELARLAHEAKAELETTEPTAVRDISACEDVVALAEGAAAGETWSGDPDVLAEWGAGALADRIGADAMWTGDPAVLAERLEGATAVAVAVHNARKPNEYTNLLLGGVDDTHIPFRNWFAGAAEGARHEALVTHEISDARRPQDAGRFFRAKAHRAQASGLSARDRCKAGPVSRGGTHRAPSARATRPAIRSSG